MRAELYTDPLYKREDNFCAAEIKTYALAFFFVVVAYSCINKFTHAFSFLIN